MQARRFLRARPLVALGFLAYLTLPRQSAGQNIAPVVSNVVAQQVSGTGNVRITYDVADANGDSVFVRIFVSSGSGNGFDLIPSTVSGDLNRFVAPGVGKEIIWNAGLDYPGRYWSSVSVKVFVRDGIAGGGEMVAVPAGSFTMGLSGHGAADFAPEHAVQVSAFLIDKYEVTNAEFKVFMDAGGYEEQSYWSPEGWRSRPSNHQPLYWDSSENGNGYQCGPGYPGFPVHGVSWYEAEAYANFVNKRLPTEAEWERAVRGDDGRLFPWGVQLAHDRATYFSPLSPTSTTTPVGFFDGHLQPLPIFQTINSPGPFGAYDQVGNVAEWVADWYSPTYYQVSPTINPTGPGPEVTGQKVTRGGGWGDANSTGNAWDSPVSGIYRRSFRPGYQDAGLGFRCVRSQ